MTHSDPEAENYLARGFRDVDAAVSGKMARCVEYLDSLPQFRQYKTQILGLMKPESGSITADLGCGLGFDVRRLSKLVGPEGRAIGVDSSMSLLESARSASEGLPGVAFIQADIQNLPFANGFLNSCKIDRTLQHVERPDAVLNEMFRTVCSGGSVVCAEPDWGRFAIGAAQDTIAERVAQTWREGFRHPRIGRELRRRLEEAGFVNLQVQEIVLTTPTFVSSDMVFDITQSAMRLRASSGSDEPLTWLSRLQAQNCHVRCAVTLVINFAQRP
jgi:ubiquinone/menaquinone biosynthesis C-methylase UbiE